MVRARRTRLAMVALVLATFGSPANASMLTTLGSVDFIDAVFGSGGGSYTKSLTSGVDSFSCTRRRL